MTIDKTLQRLQAECRRLENTPYRDESQNKRLAKLQEQTGLPVLWRAMSLYTGEIVEGATRQEMMDKIWKIDFAWLQAQHNKKRPETADKSSKKKAPKRKPEEFEALAFHEPEEEFHFGYGD